MIARKKEGRTRYKNRNETAWLSEKSFYELKILSLTNIFMTEREKTETESKKDAKRRETEAAVGKTRDININI